MSDSNKQNDNKKPTELTPVPPEESTKLLTEGAKSFSSVFFWTKEQTQPTASQLSYCDLEKKTIQIQKPAEFDLSGFAEKMKEKDATCFFSVSLPRANLFFKSLFLGAKGTQLVFKFPDKTFKVQRRKDLRFVIPQAYVLKIEIEDPAVPFARITRKAYDISAGGLSFSVPVNEQAAYTPGNVMKSITFTLRGKSITADGEIRHKSMIVEGHKKGEMKIGVSFTKITPEEANLIAAYVLEESRQVYSRFV